MLYIELVHDLITYCKLSILPRTCIDNFLDHRKNRLLIHIYAGRPIIVKTCSRYIFDIKPTRVRPEDQSRILDIFARHISRGNRIAVDDLGFFVRFQGNGRWGQYSRKEHLILDRDISDPYKAYIPDSKGVL